MKRKLLVAFLSFISASLLAQNSNFKGNIYNLENKNPISYVNIALKGTSLGTITNEVGSFIFTLPSSKTKYSNDSLIVSAIGYKSYAIRIGDIQNDALINVYLQPYTFLLKEVVVRDRANFATYIVEQMIKNIEKNYANQPYQIKGFYREASIQDTSFTRLIEAFVSIYDKGYKASLEDMRIKVEQLRKSDDNRDMDWFSSLNEWLHEKNGLYSTLAKDKLRKKMSSTHFINEIFEMSDTTEQDLKPRRFFSDFFTNSMDFSIDSIYYFEEDSIYSISYKPIRNVVRFYDVIGKLFIKASDFAVIESNTKIIFNRYLYENDTKITQKQRERLINFHTKQTIDGSTFFQTINKYVKYENKYFLKYMDYKSIGTNSSFLIFNVKEAMNSKYEKGKFYQFNQFVVTEIITDKDKITKVSKSEHIDKDDDLYDVDMPYNPNFWRNVGVFPLSPITLKMLRDLEKEKKLEQQFKNNGD